MKNKFVFSLSMALSVVFTAAMPSYAAPTINQVALKFLYVMGGVVLSSVIIFAGLTIYNRFFVKQNYAKSCDDTLKTPDNTGDAVSFFIKKNKLR